MRAGAGAVGFKGSWALRFGGWWRRELKYVDLLWLSTGVGDEWREEFGDRAPQSLPSTPRRPPRSPQAPLSSMHNTPSPLMTTHPRSNSSDPSDRRRKQKREPSRRCAELRPRSKLGCGIKDGWDNPCHLAFLSPHQSSNTPQSPRFTSLATACESPPRRDERARWLIVGWDAGQPPSSSTFKLAIPRLFPPLKRPE